jgi:hypothetical protein
MASVQVSAQMGVSQEGSQRSKVRVPGGQSPPPDTSLDIKIPRRRPTFWQSFPRGQPAALSPAGRYRLSPDSRRANSRALGRSRQIRASGPGRRPAPAWAPHHPRSEMTHSHPLQPKPLRPTAHLMARVPFSDADERLPTSEIAFRRSLLPSHAWAALVSPGWRRTARLSSRRQARLSPPRVRP